MKYFTKRRRLTAELILIFSVLLTIGTGVGTGIALAGLHNNNIRSDLKEYEPAIPTQILDRDGELITEIFSEVKRDIVPIQNIPRHLIFALTSREDSSFFEHNGFSFRGTARAAWNVLRGSYFSGGSTLTQQVAGKHFADRSKITITRKLRELWYAFQMERVLSKLEILELYINEMYFGHNTYGVEAASQFYFNHSAEEISVAESAVLVIQLASPAAYSPINHPEKARSRQKDVLDQMVELGYVTREEADISFQRYWNNYEYNRSNIASAYFDNKSKAPYFSEYVRLQLNDMLYGAININKDGYIVHTSLDLDYQKIAQNIMKKSFRRINKEYHNNKKQRFEVVEDTYIPIIDLLALGYDLPSIRVAGANEKRAALDTYYETLGPSLEMLAGMFGAEKLNTITKYTETQSEERNKKNRVEGALITLDNDTGHILAMIGGSDYETKQYNRAVDANVQPGSSFKPLYYSAAISSGQYTPATRLYDGPIVFFDEMGRKYTPMNYLGNWSGSVRLRQALANSMNVPSLQVLEGIGYDRAIDRATKMLDMEGKKDNRTLFPRSFPLGLGVTSLAPINMARAYTTFPNLGKPSEPLAITRVLSRDGEVVINPEKERIRKKKRENKDGERIMSPQSAYVMIDLLKSTVQFGTLQRRRINVGGFDGMPMAGKTGTTQNWGDAWTIGFSPYYTSVVWFGFDSPGNSLGRELTGATAAGPTWAEYMKTIHQGIEKKKFEKPDSGIVKMRVCAESGKLPTQECDDTLEEIFIAGTEPEEFCDIHPFKKKRDQELVQKLQDTFSIEDFDVEQKSGTFSGEEFSTESSISADDFDFDSTDNKQTVDEDEDTQMDEGDDTQSTEEENVNPLLE